MHNKATILIVEESKVFASLLTELSRDLGFEVSICTTGAKAANLAGTTDFDLICVGYYLADMTAEKFCQQVRLLPQAKNTRILLFTAEEHSELLRKALLAGATDVFNKKNIQQFEGYLRRFAETINQRLIGRVLLIEDSLSQLAWMTVVLRTQGLDVDSFSSAEAALECFVREDFDLVITDIVLEGSMSGINLVRAIRRFDSEKSLVPIFAVSGYDDTARRLELYHLGINDYMSKPIISEELIYRIANLIKQHRLKLELERERDSLKQLAMIDMTTGLYNRTAFHQLVPAQLAQAMRSKQATSLVIMDLDLFKTVNDTYGHDKGDLVLHDVGLWLRSTLRQGDMVFRWGGEEFLLLLNNCTAEFAQQVVEKLRQRFVLREMGGLLITASFGVSAIESYPSKKSLNDCFKEADGALYKAKEAGRNRVEVFTEM
ncbi:MAG: diguanylate cyclase [Methylococcaceae bacterium]|nr:diguanylate cyclase [Methylococcaceae bacterium]